MTTTPGGLVPAGGLVVLPVIGLGEISAGDDLGALIDAAALAGGSGRLADGDIVVVSSKVVSKALGLSALAGDRDPAITSASVRLVARRRTPHGLAQIVQAAAGPVMAAAGVDNSNVAPGTVLLLPEDPDGQARALRARLGGLTGARIGVIISDTAGRAWRDGQTDLALGAAGIAITDDLRGALDTHGQPMEVTVRAVADEIAAAADLVKGKLRSVPVAVVRGLGDLVRDGDGPGAAVLLRTPGQDWFRLGHVEAVRASLGVDPAAAAPPSVPVDDVATRLSRVLDVALLGGLASGRPGGLPGGLHVHVPSGPAEGAPGAAYSSQMIIARQDGTTAQLTLMTPGPGLSDGAELGALAQRISATAWSEDLTVEITLSPGPPAALQIEASASPP